MNKSKNKHLKSFLTGAVGDHSMILSFYLISMLGQKEPSFILSNISDINNLIFICKKGNIIV